MLAEVGVAGEEREDGDGGGSEGILVLLLVGVFCLR